MDVQGSIGGPGVPGRDHMLWASVSANIVDVGRWKISPARALGRAAQGEMVQRERVRVRSQRFTCSDLGCRRDEWEASGAHPTKETTGSHMDTPAE